MYDYFIMENIYTDDNLEYPLTTDEYNKLDIVWQFIKKFKKQFVNISDYRYYIIDEIRNNYSPKQFYFYETVANKLFWNLRTKLQKLNYTSTNNNENSYILYDIKSHTNKYELKNMLKTNYYRSFINKLIICDSDNKIAFIKEMEGSADIFKKNKFNLLTNMILFKRKLYEKIMIINNFSNILYETIKLPEYYHQLDYGFPNINYCTYNCGNYNFKMKRISKMYYDDKYDKNWYKIII